MTHWINALVLLVMLWTGFAMLVSDGHYAAYVHLVPSGVWSALHLTGHRMQGRAWHMGTALVFIANAAVYALTSITTGTWKRLVPVRLSPHEGEYTVMQRLAYLFVMAGGMVMILTGLGLWFGRRIPWLLAMFGGERTALTIHIVLALALVAFIAVHVVQVLRAGLPTLLGMITGSTAARPARARRAFALSAGALASVVAAFAIVIQTSGPSGVPAFLRWAVPHHRDHGAFAERPHDLSDVESVERTRQ